MIQLLASVALLASPLSGLGGSPLQEPVVKPEVVRGAPFLWTIEGPEGRGYLFGTIHLPDERVLALPKVVEAAFAEAGAYYSEIESSAAVTAEAQAAGLLPKGVTLPQIVGPPTWDRVAARLRSKGVSAPVIEGLKGMKAWAVAALLPALDYLPAQLKGMLPLDHQLYVRAEAEGKSVGGLEKVQEQVGIFSRLSRDQQALMLRETLDMLDRYEAKGEDAMQQTIRAWLSGKETALLALMKDSFGKDEALAKLLEQELLWDRNRVLADRIAKRLKDNNGTVSFFAVGALHMPDAPKPTAAEAAAAKEAAGSAAGGTAEERAGKTAAQRRKERKLGLVSLLRARGYRVTRVNVPPTMPAKVPAGQPAEGSGK